jgi:ornithine cyclodeaminase/alanine dehydrogenase-like protein (mu-crystallin family)
MVCPFYIAAMHSRQRAEVSPLGDAESKAVHILDAELTQRLLPFRRLIDSIAETLQRRVYAPTRTSFESPSAQWLVMPAGDDDGAICKMVRVGTAGNAANLGGAVMMLDSAGAPLALADGAVLTARRTAAMTAYVTGLLAPKDTPTLAIFGAGALALPHVEAINVVRPLSEVRVVARTQESANALVTTLRERGWSARATTAVEALHGVDIITTVTTAQTPVFSAVDVHPGAHINAVGAHRAQSREIPGQVFSRLRGVVVDSPETAWVEAGDLILARYEGHLTARQEIIDVRDRQAVATLRQDPTDVTLFKSVGHAVSDLAATRLIQRMLAEERVTA